MSAQSWLRSFKARHVRHTTPADGSSAHRPAFRPRLELLENRTLLSFGFGSAVSIGGPDMDSAMSIAKDTAGNTYVAGYYASSAVDFDPGPGTFYLNNSGGPGNIEGFAAKYLSDGTFQWAKDLGPTNEIAKIAVQGSNAYVAYIGSAGDMNVTKLDAASGNLVWPVPVQLASSSDPFYANVSLAVSPSSGNVYVSGSNSSSQAFVAKLDALGNILWTAPTAGGSALARGVALDSSENVYATGGYTGTVNFGPGRTLTSVSGSEDVFVWKLNATGVPVWAGSMGGTGDDDAGFSTGGIAVDGGGNVFVTGNLGYAQNISRNNDFDPGPGVVRLTSNGGSDIFVVKLVPDTGGALKLSWAKDIGGAGNDWGTGVAVDGAGSVYAVGAFSGSVDFDPGAKKYVLQSAGGADIFVSKLDASGNFVAAAGMGGTGYDYVNSVTLDGQGNVYTAGGFRYTVDFDPGPGTYNLTVNGNSAYQDVFVSKLTQSGSLTPMAMASTASKPTALSLALVQSPLTKSKESPLPSGQMTESDLTSAAKDDLFAGVAPGMPTGRAAEHWFFANLTHAGVKQEITNLGVIEFADKFEIMLGS